MVMRAFGILRDLLTGGLAVSLPADPETPDGAALIHTVVQVDGDIVIRVSRALFDRPTASIAADIDRHRAAVAAALKPLSTLKSWVDRLGILIASVGAGTAIGSGVRAAGVPGDALDALPVTLGGMLVSGIVMVCRMPGVSGVLWRQMFAAGLWVYRSRLVRRLSGP